MINRLYRHKYRFLISPILSAIALILTISFSPVANARLFDGPVDLLPVEERVALRQGEVILLGDKGKYICRVLTDSSVDNAWQVLTDYENFDEFLPGVIDSALLEQQGARKVFEQTNQIKALVFSVESTMQIANIETYPQEISFEAVDGDIESMKGKWTLEPVSPYPSAPPNQVLLTYKVLVKPAQTPSDELFFKIYEDRLTDTLLAIKQETEKRHQISESMP